MAAALEGAAILKWADPNSQRERTFRHTWATIGTLIGAAWWVDGWSLWWLSTEVTGYLVFSGTVACMVAAGFEFLDWPQRWKIRLAGLIVALVTLVGACVWAWLKHPRL